MKQHPLPHQHLQSLLESLNRIVCLAYLANPLGNHWCMVDVSHGKADDETGKYTAELLALANCADVFVSLSHVVVRLCDFFGRHILFIAVR